MKLCLLIFCSLIIVACGGNNNPPEEKQKKPSRPTYYGRNIDNTVRIITYDVYGQKLGDGFGFYILPDIIVTPMSWFKGAFSAKVNLMDSRTPYNVFGYVAYDIDDDLVALRIAKRRNEKLNPIDTTVITICDTVYSLDNQKGKTIKSNFSVSENITSADLAPGTPIFDISGNFRGIASKERKVIASAAVERLKSRCGDGHNNIYDLRLKTNKKYPDSKSIAGFRIKTTMGNIEIRLFDETPLYRDNFIRLVCDDFYDSLLVHRVLPNYLIQTGAADSKYAGKDDVVGWQGPGYTIPQQIVPQLFHKRGMVAASKLPHDHNKSNRSDGSQFYIVAGRKFTNTELDDIEKEYGKKFSAAQREAYTTVGGAPYLDDDYTVFARVTAGMDVVDRIAAVPLEGDRPKTDIRVLDIAIIRR